MPRYSKCYLRIIVTVTALFSLHTQLARDAGDKKLL